MPTLAQFIAAEKSDVDEGSWQSGNVSPTAFPLSKAKNKRFKFGKEYKWRLVRFSCLGYKCRVLILFNDGKFICRSSFGVEIDNDLAVLCTHEYHASHPGWHCHLTMMSHDKVTPGLFRSGQRRWPQASARHSRVGYGITEASALSHVAERYRFQAQGGLI